MTQIIDGSAVANELRERLSQEILQLKDQHGMVPGLATVLVGDDPASQVYVNMKNRACAKIGITSRKIELPAETTQVELLDVVEGLNRDDAIHGILVQLPLPRQIEQQPILDAIDPGKDVDGLHPVNLGRLFSAKYWDELPRFIPCTPHGAMELIDRTGVEIEGKNAVVLGRSPLVGKPVAMLLLARGATVTLCHSKTKALADVTRSADILVAAVGSAGLVTGEMIKPGAVVIDVGTNRVDADNERGYKLVGDVDFDSANGVAGHLTPVPKGVGPMTITMLLYNTVASARAAASA